MSIGGGMVNQPTHVLRFLRVNGRAMGQLFTYWMTPKAGSEEEAFLDHMARVGRSKCELVRGRVFSACRLTPHSNPDWEALGRALDSIGAWNASNTWAVARRRHTVVALSDTGPWIATMEGTASDQPIYSFEYRTGRSYAMTTYDGQSAAPANFKVLYAAVMKAYR